MSRFSKIARHGQALSRPSTSSIRLNSCGEGARNIFAKTRFALLSGHDADYFNGLLTKP
jgi:hypothetical protein